MSSTLDKEKSFNTSRTNWITRTFEIQKTSYKAQEENAGTLEQTVHWEYLEQNEHHQYFFYWQLVWPAL